MLTAGCIGWAAAQSTALKSLETAPAGAVSAEEIRRAEVHAMKSGHQAAQMPSAGFQDQVEKAKPGIEALVAEMQANASNPAYDMKAALQRLHASPYVIYPLDVFDPAVAPIYRSGNAAADEHRALEIKKAWLKAQP
jgi:hypothetical protein